MSYQNNEDAQLVQPNADNAPPPPYVEEKRSIKFWRKYGDDENVYCCTECLSRTSCTPCFIVSGVFGCVIGCIGQSCYGVGACICQDGYCDHPRSSEAVTNFVCCPLYTLDRCNSVFPICCVGCVKFPHERNEKEKHNIQVWNECMSAFWSSLYNCFNCPCNFCEYLCNTDCMKSIAKCCNKGFASIGNCCCGCVRCCELVARRICCCPSQPEKQEMK